MDSLSPLVSRVVSVCVLLLPFVYQSSVAGVGGDHPWLSACRWLFYLGTLCVCTRKTNEHEQLKHYDSPPIFRLSIAAVVTQKPHIAMMTRKYTKIAASAVMPKHPLHMQESCASAVFQLRSSCAR
jgi:hypothetical protein